MTTPAGSGPVAPLQLTPLERPAFAALFAAADPASSGIITGSSAVQFFSKSRPALDGTVLGAIWSLADRANNGFLGKAEWAVAMRLLGHAQRGTAADQLEGMLSQPGPPPSFEGVTLPGAQATPTRASSVAQVPQVSPADRARYTRIFASSGPVNGLLDGEKAKGILVRSKLPFDQLGQIWGLADTRSRGALDLTDFIIAMHFLQASMNGSLGSAGLPATLPPGLYEQAAGGAAVPPGSPSRGLTAQHTGGSIPGGIPRQLTGQGFSQAPTSPPASTIRQPLGARPSGFLSPQQTGAPAAVPTLAGDWLVSPADKAKADRFFDGLDTERKGTLEGQAAVPFFMQSGLPEATLAHVWDLSDITQSGNLSRDEFAVAMHLINGALTGSQLPQELPAGLIPPSLRGRDLPAAVNPQESDTQKDLFSLMDDDEPTALPVNPASAFVKPTSSVSAVPPPPAPKGTGPFDDDFFSGPVAAAATPSALSPAVTGNNSAIRAAASPVPPVTDASAEVGNKRLALDSTNKALTGLQSKRAELEQTVSTNSTDIAELESRLTVVRATHDKESAAVKTLQERATSQAAELKTLREETIRAESDLSALRAEKDEIEQTVLRDREDVRDMKKRMAELQAENNTLRTALEKLRKEARQQKGLTAISRKQLSSAESEGDKLRSDISAVESGEVLESGNDPTTGAGQTPASVTSPVLSPAGSVRSTNPFDRFHAANAESAPGTPHARTASLAAGGAAAGADLGLAGAGVTHAGAQAGADADATPTPPPAAANDVDPFGVPKPGLGPTPPQESSAAFDDDFGQAELDSEAPKQVIAAPSLERKTTGGSAFDEAFADLEGDSVALPSTTIAETADVQPIAEHTAVPVKAAAESVTAPADAFQDFEDSFAPPGAISAINEGAAKIPPTAASPAAEEREILGDEGFAAHSILADHPPRAQPALGVSESKGKEPRREEEDADSSDDDEGPEDIERVTSPEEVGSGKTPQAPLASLPPANTTTQAAERFPELDEDDVVPVSSSLEAASGPTTAPLTAQTTGDDTFVDAPSETPNTASGFGASQWANASGVTNTASSIGAPSEDFGHERFTTAAEPALASSAGIAQPSNASERSLSPAATKNRRAPPPKPVRNTAASADASSPFQETVALPAAVDESGIAATTGAQATRGPSTATSFDDFDSAFEDLGPAAPATNTATSTSAGAPPLPSFDDAFGDADGFDFVPSFSTSNGQTAPNAAAPTTARGSIQPANDAFGSAFPQTAQAAPSSDAVPGGFGFDDFAASFNASSGANGAEQNSNTSSGFSFADEFNPTPATAAPSTGGPYLPPPGPPPASGLAPSSAAPPSLPGRGGGVSPAPSPAAADDAGPVRQLCAMGFSREKVIQALEKSNYKVDRALERLLAAA